MMAAITLPASAPADTRPDAALVRRARAGERSAQRALYTRHAGRSLALATRVLACHADAEDAVHDAFADAFGRLHRLRDPGAFGAWLRRIVLNRCHRTLRRRRLRGLLGLSYERDATLDRLAAPDCAPERRAELRRIAAVLEEQAPAVRICWCLRRVEGHTLPEIAEAVGLSLATVKRRIAVADRAVSAAMGQ